MWTKNMIDEGNEALLPWQGGNARLWYYAASHSELHLQITKAERVGQLHFVCEGCSHLLSPVEWGNMMLEIIPLENERKQIVVRDSIAGFRVVCALISIRKQVGVHFHGPV
jgi:hypothetical protein